MTAALMIVVGLLFFFTIVFLIAMDWCDEYEYKPCLVLLQTTPSWGKAQAILRDLETGETYQRVGLYGSKGDTVMVKHCLEEK